MPDHEAGDQPVVAQAFELSINECQSWQCELPLALCVCTSPIYVCPLTFASVLQAASSAHCNFAHAAVAALQAQLTRCGSCLYPTNASWPVRCKVINHLSQTSQLQLGAILRCRRRRRARRRARPALRACHKSLLTHSLHCSQRALTKRHRSIRCGAGPQHSCSSASSQKP